jgi:hypothetical protein
VVLSNAGLLLAVLYQASPTLPPVIYSIGCLNINQAPRTEKPQMDFFWQGLNRVLKSP